MSFSSKSLSFNGSSKYVTLGDIHAFERTDAFSISCWFKTSAAVEQALVAKLGDLAQGYELALHSDGKVDFVLYGASAAVMGARTTSAFNDGAWHHVLAVYDGSSTYAGLAVFVDGVAQATTNVGSATIATTIVDTEALEFGRRAHTTSQYFTGNIDDIAIYDSALALLNAKQIYNGGNPRDNHGIRGKDNLVGYWLMGDGDTSPTILDWAPYPYTDMVAGATSRMPIFTDRSGNGYDGLGSSYYVDTDVRYEVIGSSTFSKKVVRAGGPLTTYRLAKFGPILRFGSSDAFSVSFWFRTSVSSTNPEIIVHNASDPWPGGMGYAFGLHTDKVWGHFRGDSGSWWLNIYTVSTYNDGAWHHAVATWDGTGTIGGFLLYVDGSLASITTDGTTTSGMPPYAREFALGSLDGYLTGFFGDYDEVSIWDTELSLLEVQEIYNSGSPADLSSHSAVANLQAWWSFEEVGDAHPGLLVNMDHSNFDTGDTPGGVAAASFAFNGTDEYVEVGNYYNFRSDAPFSISFWAKIPDTASVMHMVSKVDATQTGYRFLMNADGTIQGGIYLNDTTGRVIKSTTSGLDNNTWRHFVLTYDGSNLASGLTIYVNAVAETPVVVYDNLGTNEVVDNAPLRFGASALGSPGYLAGKLAEIAIYNRELDSTDVSAIYNSGTPIDPTGIAGSVDALVGYWPALGGYHYGTMTGMSGADIQDESPYVSTITPEKTWESYEYPIGGTSQNQTYQELILDWKDKLVNYGDWTVVGTSDGVGYEWEGETAGGSYGGTNAYDRWAAYTDIVWDYYTDSHAVSWCVLRSPLSGSNQFWLMLAYRSLDTSKVYAWVSNSKPSLPATPVTQFPVPSTDQWHYVMADIATPTYGKTLVDAPGTNAVRTYLSVCPSDGSFIFCRYQLGVPSKYSAIQQFHVLTQDLPEEDFPMHSAAMAEYVSGTMVANTCHQLWWCYLPIFGQLRAFAMQPFHRWGDGNDVRILLSTNDTGTGDAFCWPARLVAVSRVGTGQYLGNGASIVIGRLSDVYFCGSAQARGTMAPFKTPYKYTCFESIYWIPGLGVPTFA